jgi:ATP-dependent exoDNAse (exonuclease V) beta subunit
MHKKFDLPDFSHIQFDPTKHSYVANGAELTGVTRFLSQYQKPFDQATMAARVAERDGRPVESVLAEWAAKGRASLALGTTVHEHIQSVLNNGAAVSDDPFLALNTKSDCPEIEAFGAFWAKAKTSMEPVAVEWVVGDDAAGVAGTIDCLMHSSKTGLLHLVDWKTGKFDTYNRFEFLLPPFEGENASKLNIYSLQLSAYRLILERAGLKLGESYIIHFSYAGAQTHKAVDYRPQLEKIFNDLEVPFS